MLSGYYSAKNYPGAFFDTRAKDGMDARRVYSHPADRASGPAEYVV
jgi:hypothetical protein